MSKKIFIVFVFIFLISLNTSSSVHELDYSIDESLLNNYYDSIYAPDSNVTFIIELDEQPLAAYESVVKSDELQLMSNLDKIENDIINDQVKVMQRIKNTIRRDVDNSYTYTTLLNGFSLDAKYEDLENIKKIPGVKNVYISQTHHKLLPHISVASGLTGISTVQNNFGFKGEGQVIAILDNEFDVYHEFFSDPINPKYSQDDIESMLSSLSVNASSDVYKSSKIPFAYDYGNRDSDTKNDISGSHGTHVAGIAAGKNGFISDSARFSGVAPEAQIICMKVSDSRGYITDAACLAALDDAAKFGVSAINMSFGADYESPVFQKKFEEIVSNARNMGILISASSGNASRGYKNTTPITEYMDYSACGMPANFSASTAVASSDNATSRLILGNLNVNNTHSVKYNLPFSGSAFYENFHNGQFEYVYCAYGTSSDFAGINCRGKIALIRRGNNTFQEKASNAAAAGASGIIFWNNDETFINTAVVSLPAALVTQSGGQTLFNAEIKNITAGILTEQSYSFESTKMSNFSSWGTSESLELKPDITAPGKNIYSSVPNNDYQYKSGTSMAAPQITGITAILNQYYETNPFSVLYNNFVGADKVTLFENLLMSTATVIKKNNIPMSPRQQGAGLVNAEKAIKTPVILTGTQNKTKINLGDNLSNDILFSFTARNLSSKAVTYTSLSADVITDSYFEKSGKYYIDSTKKLTADITLPESITIPANSSVSIPVHISINTNEITENLKVFSNGFYIDGFVYLNTEDEALCSLNIPFTGFYGNWKNIPIFDTTVYDEGGSSLYRTNDSTSTGTLLVSGNANKYITMGQNKFTGRTDYKHIAFSPNNDGLYDDFILKLQLLRTAAIYANITTKDGTQIKQNLINRKINKYDSASYNLTPYLNGLSDGNYIMTVTGYSYDYKKTTFPDDILTLPFVIDTALPIISEISISNSSSLLTVSAHDNHYIQAVSVSYTNKNGESTEQVIPFENIKSNNTEDYVTAEFDISQADTGSISVKVYDYAMNVAEKVLEYGYDLYINSSDIAYSNSLTTLKYKIENISENAISAVPMIAFYNADNKLIYVYSQNHVSVSSGNNEYTFYINKDLTNSYFYRLFLWDSVDTMKPLCK